MFFCSSFYEQSEKISIIDYTVILNFNVFNLNSLRYQELKIPMETITLIYL